MKFEWDEVKRQTNIEKHGVDFVDAIHLFSNPYLQWSNQDHDEIRYVAVGKMKSLYIVVVYTPRKNKKRIISARPANKSERWRYDEKYGKN